MDLISVSERLTCAAHIRRLDYHLRVPDHKIQTALYDHRFINEAGFQVLQSFIKVVANETEAFVQLKDALMLAGFQDIVMEVLARRQD